MHYFCPDLRKGNSSLPKRKVADEEAKSTEILLTNHSSEYEIYLKNNHRQTTTQGKRKVLSQGLFGGGISPNAEHGRFSVIVESLDRKYSTSVALLDQPKICSTLPRIRDKTLLTKLASRGIVLTDIGRDTPPIRILLGADVLGSILTGRIEVEDWRFVPGEVNPADLPSRSCNWFELLQSKWWEGPKWLYEPPEFWPYTEITLPEEAMKERRKSVVMNLNIDTKEHFGNRLLYFSSYPRIIRMIAWILRFCQNIKVNSHKLTKELSYEEIQSAEEALIRIIQSEWPTDIQEKYAQTIQFYEENKILKVKSRLILEKIRKILCDLPFYQIIPL
ncbi:reverse transcriptase [Caerostris extrusa]|uniref:Reverse transcriptase n=1 Tax=Caerostris extrusa TaxID=172846 RepID=A0AAV4WDN6_CAEEX|nr:reverse transcriptase [Caerostris extrusa]